MFKLGKQFFSILGVLSEHILLTDQRALTFNYALPLRNLVPRDRVTFRPCEHQATETLELGRVAPKRIATARRSKSSILEDAVAISPNSFSPWRKFLGSSEQRDDCRLQRPLPGAALMIVARGEKEDLGGLAGLTRAFEFGHSQSEARTNDMGRGALRTFTCSRMRVIILRA